MIIGHSPKNTLVLPTKVFIICHTHTHIIVCLHIMCTHMSIQLHMHKHRRTCVNIHTCRDVHTAKAFVRIM